MAGRRGSNGRQRLIDAAFELFARQGIERTTSREIAARAGVALGLIHRHFGTVDGLVQATDRRAIEWTEIRMSRSLPFLGQLAGAPQAPDARDEATLSYLKATLLSGREGSAEVYFAVLAASTRLCASLQREGVLRGDASAAALAQFLLIAELGGLAAWPQHAARAAGGRRRPRFLRSEIMTLIAEALKPPRDRDSKRVSSRTVIKPAR